MAAIGYSPMTEDELARAMATAPRYTRVKQADDVPTEAEKRPRLRGLTEEEVESWSTSFAVAMGAQYCPRPLRKRLERISPELGVVYAPPPSQKVVRNEMIREFDRLHVDPQLATRNRAEIIAKELDRALSIKAPTSQRQLLAKQIVSINKDKSLGWQTIFALIK